MKLKVSTLKKQRENAELELIIEEMGRAMRNANRNYIASPPACPHDSSPRFTLSMEFAWSRYVVFCKEHPDD